MDRPDCLDRRREKRFQRTLLAGLVVLALLTPLGIVLPRLFNAGSAWGEWEPSRLYGLLGFIPEGLKRTADLWRSPVPDYSFSQAEGTAAQASSYVLSALLGLALVFFFVFLITRTMRRNGE